MWTMWRGWGGRVSLKCSPYSVRNKPENANCPASNLKTNATCPPQFKFALHDSFINFLKMLISGNFVCFFV